MSSDKYNGWTNKETWTISLWLNNDEASYKWLQNMIQYALNNYDNCSYLNQQQSIKYCLADHLKNNIEDMSPLGNDCNLYADLLGTALAHVNWDEIAQNELQEIDQYKEAV